MDTLKQLEDYIMYRLVVYKWNNCAKKWKALLLSTCSIQTTSGFCANKEFKVICPTFHLVPCLHGDEWGEVRKIWCLWEIYHTAHLVLRFINKNTIILSIHRYCQGYKTVLWSISRRSLDHYFTQTQVFPFGLNSCLCGIVTDLLAHGCCGFPLIFSNREAFFVRNGFPYLILHCTEFRIKTHAAKYIM